MGRVSRPQSARVRSLRDPGYTERRPRPHSAAAGGRRPESDVTIAGKQHSNVDDGEGVRKRPQSASLGTRPRQPTRARPQSALATSRSKLKGNDHDTPSFARTTSASSLKATTYSEHVEKRRADSGIKIDRPLKLAERYEEMKKVYLTK